MQRSSASVACVPWFSGGGSDKRRWVMEGSQIHGYILIPTYEMTSQCMGSCEAITDYQGCRSKYR